MTTQEQIDLIVKERYGEYKGRMMKNLKQLHRQMRRLLGDDGFLRHLNDVEIKIPRVPKYEIP